MKGNRAAAAGRSRSGPADGADVVVQGNTGGSTAPEFEIVLKGLASNIGRITGKDIKQ